MAQNKQTEKKVGIKDIFLLLPNSAFGDEKDIFTLENRKKMLKTIDQKPNTAVTGYYKGSYAYIKECAPRNGYLSAFYDSLEQYLYHICYWNLKDGRKLVGVTRDNGFGELKFYLYENGKLREDSSYAPDVKNVQLSDFFDISGLNAGEKKNFQQFFKEEIVFQYVLPRKGTSIKMTLGFIPFDMDYESVFDELGDKLKYKHILFKWVNEKWVKEVQKGPGREL